VYKIIISKLASKEILKLPKSVAIVVFDNIKTLSMNPKPKGYKKLKGIKEDIFRIRIGDYRVLYTIEEKIKIVDIRTVKHRKDAYKL
jgi:mRNA interferase RelE/StbE